MTKSNVVGLRGIVPSNGKAVDDDVVKMLKDLLERAESGEINGIACALHYYDELSNRCYTGAISFGMIGRLFELQTNLLADLQEPEK